jgi:hypothetical protein
MLEQTQSQPNHTSYRNFHFNEFVANVLRDNIGSKKNQPLTSKKNDAVFSFKYQKFRVKEAINQMKSNTMAQSK